MSAVADDANRPTDADAPFEDASFSTVSALPETDSGDAPAEEGAAAPVDAASETAPHTAEAADATVERRQAAAEADDAQTNLEAAPEANALDDAEHAAQDHAAQHHSAQEHAQDDHAQDDHAQDDHAQDDRAQEDRAQEDFADDGDAEEDHAEAEHAGEDPAAAAGVAAAADESDEPGPVDGVLEVEICGQAAAMACGEGDAPRLRRIAAVINRAGAGLAEAGIVSARPLDDARFMFMNAMTIADEMLSVEARLAEAEAKLEMQDRNLRALRQRARRAEAAQAAAEEKLSNTVEQHASAARQAFEASFAEVVSKAAKRLEAAAGRLEGR